MDAPPLRVDHVALPCYDAAATDRFYTGVMGFELVSVLEGRSPEWGDRGFLLACYATGDGRLIDFFRVEGLERPATPGLEDEIRHLAFTTASAQELEGWRQRLAAHGIAFEEDAHGGLHDSLYLRDPNGVQIEITWWQRRYDVEDARRARDRLDARLAGRDPGS